MRKRLMVCGWINKHKHSISNPFFRVISLNEFWKFLWLRNSAWDFFPGGGTPLNGLYWYVPLNKVWFSRFRVLNRVWKFNYWASWTGCLFGLRLRPLTKRIEALGTRLRSWERTTPSGLMHAQSFFSPAPLCKLWKHRFSFPDLDSWPPLRCTFPQNDVVVLDTPYLFSIRCACLRYAVPLLDALCLS